MAEGLYDEAIIDVVGPEAMLSKPATVKDLVLKDITVRQLDFATPFTLVSTVERRTKVNSFILYFDTFFTILNHQRGLDRNSLAGYCDFFKLKRTLSNRRFDGHANVPRCRENGLSINNMLCQPRDFRNTKNIAPGRLAGN